MDNSNQQVTQTAATASPSLSYQTPATSSPTSSRSILSRLFTGRLNRSGYLLGIFAIGAVITIISMILFSVLSLVLKSVLVTALPLGLAFIFFLFYAFSLSLRRLHDLNRSGWWLLLFLPGEIGTMIFLFASFIPSVQTQLVNILQVIPSFVDTIFTVIRWIANIFSLYMLLWPGTDDVNNYGAPTASWGIKEVLGFAEPKLQEASAEEQPTQAYQTT